MSNRRQAELRKQNRLLVRQEGLAERDMQAAIQALSNDIIGRFTYGAEDALLQIVTDHQPMIANILATRLNQTSLIFGGRTLERLESVMPKSYYPGLPFGYGPVRGRDEPGIETKNAREIFESTILQWVRLHALSRAETVTGTLREAVRSIIVDSINDGLGESGTIAMIRAQIGQRLSRTNAARIARTEMHTASTIASDEAARSTGLDMIKEWLAAEDHRTRESHADANGQEVPLNDPFIVGGSRLMVPGDPSGPAKEIINCRCAVLHHPIIAGEVIR